MKKPAADSNQRDFYEDLPRLMPGRQFRFMNHGYAHLRGQDKLPWLSGEDKKYILNVQLLDQVVSGLDLKGKDVLDIGCGRGGNSWVLARYFEPKNIIGLDYAKSAISLCKKNSKGPNLKFVHGSAMSLPFVKNKFDAVINVESSHCYPDLTKFFKEVFRVLKPGGVFRYTDVMVPRNVPHVTKLLVQQGFVVHRRTDITKNVIRAITRGESSFRKTLFDACRSQEGRKLAKNLCDFLQGTILSAYNSKKSKYVIWNLEKPAD